MQVKLSEILSSLESGGRPKGGASLDNNGIPSLGAEHLDGNGGFNFKSVKYIPEDYFNGLKSGIIEKENILIVKDGATTGKVSFVNDEFPFEKAAVNEHVFLLKIDKSKAYPRFAFHYLKCSQGQKDIMRDFRGATVGGISRGFVDFVKFQLPPLPDQLHIANILSKAENLIAQRKESIRLLDEFLKSTFLEMFGDPVRNEKGFKRFRFGDFLVQIIAGSSYGGEQKELLKDDEYGVLKVSAVSWGVFNPKEFKVVNKKDIHGELVHPQKGDLLFSRANTRELVGATCIVDDDYPKLFLPDKLWNLVLNDTELNNIFTHYLFQNKSFKNILTREASGTSGSMLNISMEKLRNIKFHKPPLSLQTQFAQIVEKTEALKSQYQQSLSELENLYGSLSQKAFRGELTQNKNHVHP